MQTSQKGIEMIKEFENCVLTAYPDGNGYSIGYGHYGANAGDVITQEQAEELLQQDLEKFEQGVSSLLEVEVSQPQFDALVSYAYNCGVSGLSETKMLIFINNEEHEEAVEEWPRGWEESSLLGRREKEAELYSSGIEKG